MTFYGYPLHKQTRHSKQANHKPATHVPLSTHANPSNHRWHVPSAANDVNCNTPALDSADTMARVLPMFSLYHRRSPPPRQHINQTAAIINLQHQVIYTCDRINRHNDQVSPPRLSQCPHLGLRWLSRRNEWLDYRHG